MLSCCYELNPNPSTKEHASHKLCFKSFSSAVQEVNAQEAGGVETTFRVEMHDNCTPTLCKDYFNTFRFLHNLQPQKAVDVTEHSIYSLPQCPKNSTQFGSPSNTIHFAVYFCSFTTSYLLDSLHGMTPLDRNFCVSQLSSENFWSISQLWGSVDWDQPTYASGGSSMKVRRRISHAHSTRIDRPLMRTAHCKDRCWLK